MFWRRILSSSCSVAPRAIEQSGSYADCYYSKMNTQLAEHHHVFIVLLHLGLACPIFNISLRGTSKTADPSVVGFCPLEMLREPHDRSWPLGAERNTKATQTKASQES